MSDIVERLRAITGQAGDHGDVRLCDEAADEIARLRAQPCPYVTGTVTHYCTLTPFTLTDAEREAVARAAKFADDAAGYCQHADNAELARKNAAILRGLLERTSDGATTASDATKETGKRAGSTRLG